MAVTITREHTMDKETLDKRVVEIVTAMAEENGLAVTESADCSMKIAGMGANGEITWDEKQVTITASMAFAFGAADSQLRGIIEGTLNNICDV
jgi:Putative polyhydroxyalkanoic acid system protein (PHA_gran_rgn)